MSECPKSILERLALEMASSLDQLVASENGWRLKAKIAEARVTELERRLYSGNPRRDQIEVLESRMAAIEASAGEFERLEAMVVEWAAGRGIFENSDSKTQCLKTVSEVGELADNIAKGKDVRDDIGDILVTLILLTKMQGTTLQECLAVAYDEIKDRKGKMVNGTFVKEGE